MRVELRVTRGDLPQPRRHAAGSWRIALSSSSSATPPRGVGAAGSSTRTAFTLVEVLLALALSGVLIASVVASLDLYRRLSTAGHRDVERARLSRAVFALLSDDLRSVTFTPDEDESASLTSDDVGAAEEETDAEVEDVTGEQVDTEAAYAGGAIGLAGDEISFVIHTNQPDRGEATAAFTLPELLEIGGRTGDQRSVSYFVVQSGSSGLAGVVADRLIQSSPDPLPRDEPLGLVRLEGDRLAMSLADDTGDYETLAAGATLIAPEVKSMFVRYFDGVMWHDAWDTDAYQMLPRAVEITLGIRIDPAEPRVRQPGEFREEQPPNVVEHRFVVNLPQADRLALEELQ